MPQTVPARRDIPIEYTWDAASIFPTDADWEAEIARVDGRLPELAAFRGRLSEGPETLLEYFAAAEDVLRSAGKIGTYATLNYSVDTADQAGVAMRDRAQALSARAQSALAFAEPELLAIGMETLEGWTAAEPRLAAFRHLFDQIRRRREHIRSAEVEGLLRQLADPFGAASATHGILANADLQFPPARDSAGETYEITQGTINALLNHPDREVRRTGWEHYADSHLALKNTMANCLAAGVKQNVFFARARNYASALEAALKPNYIPLEVFHNLIAVFRANLPTWHRYWRIRKAALGYDTLHVYDTRAPLTAQPARLPYTQAVEWICAGMAPLGEEYVRIMRNGLTQQRWVDVYPNQGKRAGAFSTGVQGTHPFIMMSYNDDIFGLSTLAHELGHSMHSYYSRSTQPYVYSNYGLFVAEVASNFNQALVRNYLLESNPERNFQISVIEEAMANFHRYFFIMPTLARFELTIHERVEQGQALTSAYLIDLMADLFAEGYGDEVIVDRERVGITWGQFATHLYANFYVYQYATGISGAHALARGVIEGREGAVERYLAFLKAGGSKYPLDALQLAGADLASPAPVEETFGVLASLVDRLEKLV
jgi:oligoendopeptidase F